MTYEDHIQAIAQRTHARDAALSRLREAQAAHNVAQDAVEAANDAFREFNKHVLDAAMGQASGPSVS